MICRRMMPRVKMPPVIIFSMQKQKYVCAIAGVLAVLSVIAASRAKPYRVQHAFAAAQNAAAAGSRTARQVTTEAATGEAAAREAKTKEVTFNRDLAPIVFHICANCHGTKERVGSLPTAVLAESCGMSVS